MTFIIVKEVKVCLDYIKKSFVDCVGMKYYDREYAMLSAGAANFTPFFIFFGLAHKLLATLVTSSWQTPVVSERLGVRR